MLHSSRFASVDKRSLIGTGRREHGRHFREVLLASATEHPTLVIEGCSLGGWSGLVGRHSLCSPSHAMILKRQATSSPAPIILRVAQDKSFGTTGRADAVTSFLLNKHVWHIARDVLGDVIACPISKGGQLIRSSRRGHTKTFQATSSNNLEGRDTTAKNSLGRSPFQ